VSYAYDFPRPSVTVDCVVFGFDEGDLKVLLIKRNGEPYRGKWALPGGFVGMDESLDEAAMRELREETGLPKLYLEQLYTFGSPERDPRGRVISVAYYALVKLADYRLAAATDAADVAWFSVADAPSLAFDHSEILDTAIRRLKGKVRYQPVGFELLPVKFTLSQLQHLYEAVLEESLDKRNFRKKIVGTGLLVELDEIEQDVAHRAARLYKFDDRKYRQLAKKGFNFEI
jgi:8-oxo-dGTP diphosphatase